MSIQQDSNTASDNPLSSYQITLVKESWKKLAPKLIDVAQKFYINLFDLDPSLQSMFDETDMDSQHKKFTDTITVVVKGLDQFEVLGPAIGELGNRHVGYGVSNEHYAIVKKALLDAIEFELESDFTSDAKIAWIKTYDAMSTLMREGSTGKPLTSPGL